MTQILREVLGDAIWQASDWYLQRGRAVHAAMALLAQGKRFEYDRQIEPQIKAGKKFFADFSSIADFSSMKILAVETTVFSKVYQLAGTPDLVVRFPKKGMTCLIDYKSALSEVAPIQLGGYSAMCPKIRWGMVVVLLETGDYKATGIFDLRQARNEFLACRSVYSIRQRLGLIKSKEVSNGN